MGMIIGQYMQDHRLYQEKESVIKFWKEKAREKKSFFKNVWEKPRKNKSFIQDNEKENIHTRRGKKMFYRIWGKSFIQDKENEKFHPRRGKVKVSPKSDEPESELIRGKTCSHSFSWGRCQLHILSYVLRETHIMINLNHKARKWAF